MMIIWQFCQCSVDRQFWWIMVKHRTYNHHVWSQLLGTEDTSACLAHVATCYTKTCQHTATNPPSHMYASLHIYTPVSFHSDTHKTRPRFIRIGFPRFNILWNIFTNTIPQRIGQIIYFQQAAVPSVALGFYLVLWFVKIKSHSQLIKAFE